MEIAKIKKDIEIFSLVKSYFRPIRYCNTTKELFSIAVNISEFGKKSLK